MPPTWQGWYIPQFALSQHSLQQSIFQICSSIRPQHTATHCPLPQSEPPRTELLVSRLYTWLEEIKAAYAVFPAYLQPINIRLKPPSCGTTRTQAIKMDTNSGEFNWNTLNIKEGLTLLCQGGTEQFQDEAEQFTRTISLEIHELLHIIYFTRTTSQDLLY